MSSNISGPKLKKILVATFGLRTGNLYYTLYKDSKNSNYRLIIGKNKANFTIGG